METESAEREMLRKELQMLKDCQISYFKISTTATGLIIGLGDKFGTDDFLQPIALAPLLIILPCWFTFYDKATTVTRIVGYYRVLEKILTRQGTFRYVGWENALDEYRKKYGNSISHPMRRRFRAYLRDAFQAIPLLLKFSRTHRYWVINWFTFFGLSFASLALAITFGVEDPGKYSAINRCGIIFFGSLTLLAIIHTLYMLKNLSDPGGKFSYEKNSSNWEGLLHKPDH